MKFSCNHCGQHIESDQGLAGMEIACPTCGAKINVPTIAPPGRQVRKSEVKDLSGIFGTFFAVIGLAYFVSGMMALIGCGIFTNWFVSVPGRISIWNASSLENRVFFFVLLLIPVLCAALLCLVVVKTRATGLLIGIAMLAVSALIAYIASTPMFPGGPPRVWHGLELREVAKFHGIAAIGTCIFWGLMWHWLNGNRSEPSFGHSKKSSWR